MNLSKEQQETVDRIIKDREKTVDTPLSSSVIGEAAANAPQGPADYTEIVATAVERARRDALQDYSVEKAKLDFAAGSAWAIACFGIVMIALVAWLGFKRVLHPSKLIALGLIVTSALLLIVLGYTDEQMAPTIGLLGTIAGYMLGSKEWDGNDAAATTAADAETAATAKREAAAKAATAERTSAEAGATDDDSERVGDQPDLP